jgi:hypothetical protein
VFHNQDSSEHSVNALLGSLASEHQRRLGKPALMGRGLPILWAPKAMSLRANFS